MATPEKKSKSPYRQFAKSNKLHFVLNRLCPDGSVITRVYDTQIADTKGGGFHGQVLVFEGLPFILKTAVPGDPWHDLWRRVNWGARDFPYQVNELDAKLGQVKTDLIHDILEPITQGRFYAPRSFGYTSLPGTFAQAVERLYGRPPRYDNCNKEFLQFRQAQAELTELAYQCGFEHVAQPHIDNKYGMANLWWNPDLHRWEWFDTLPAIRHTGWVWPFFYFGFHRQIRQRLSPDTKEVTFDKIHTDTLRKTIEVKKGLFSKEGYCSIQSNVDLYESLIVKQQRGKESPRNFGGLAYAVKESMIDLSRASATKAKETITIPVRILTDPAYINGLVLSGVRQAFETRTIGENEFQEAVSLVQSLSQQERGRNKLLHLIGGVSLWSSLYSYYHASGLLLKVPEVAAYASFGLTDMLESITKLDISPLTIQEDRLEKLAIVLGAFSGFRAIGALNSYIATKFIGRLIGRNLDTAARISAIPAIGIHLAIPAQICVDTGNRSKAIWHYTVRNAIAKISKIKPEGGWGTEFEGRLWNRFGKWLESWAK